MNSLSLIVETLKTQHPLLYQAFFKKKLEGVPKEYSDIRMFQTSLASHNLIPQWQNDLDKVWFMMGLKLLDYDMPIYHLTSKFIEIAHNTNLPEEFSFEDFHYPFPAFILALPETISRQLFKTYIDFIAIGMLKDKEQLTCHISKEIIINSKSRINFLITSTDNIQSLHIHYAVTDFSEDKLSIFKLPNMGVPYIGEEWRLNNPALENTLISFEEEKLLPAKCALLAMKIIGILNAAPTLLSPAELKTSIKSNGHKKHFTYHKPIFIDYPHTKTEGDMLIETNQHKAMHWRRGHLRKQRFGPLLSSVKIIWIEPVLVNKPTE